MSDFEKSNSNIFADLGDPEAEQTLVRAQILSRIIDIINERNFTEAETAETLGISKLEASQLIKGKLSQFSLEDLFHILNALDKDVEIILKPKVVLCCFILVGVSSRR
ncbi:helix-turn-helix transcriptional regulator [Microcystis sp. LSC13-02]|uniref:helix-turn-helix domain-containing protein n=1 Tax=Microcystis sp. LSC13-02 TaxID=1895004 RepID=UPI00257E2BD6|nr:helix-turn-helix transcriptional regulator [Microcystis sp. LSC13-02]NCS04957.1 XRE family transcriptional regulator [Microcystis aeruginosa G13-11]